MSLNSLKKKMIACGCTPAKEFLYYAVFVLLLVALEAALYFWKGVSYYLLFPVLILVVFTFVFLTRYDNRLKAKAERDEEEFVRLFTYFGIYIDDGYNIYSALSGLLPYANDSVKPRLERLLQEIDDDKSVTPFITFAETFSDKQIRQVMMSVYQMVDQGSTGVFINQFSHLFGRLSDQKHEESKRRRTQKLSSLSFLPLLGSGVAMVMLTTALVEIMGGVMNGL